MFVTQEHFCGVTMSYVVRISTYTNFLNSFFFFLFLQLISGLNYSCSLWDLSCYKVWLENSQEKSSLQGEKKTNCQNTLYRHIQVVWCYMVIQASKCITPEVHIHCLVSGEPEKKSVFASVSLSPRESDALKARNASTSWLMRRKSWEDIIQIWR